MIEFGKITFLRNMAKIEREPESIELHWRELLDDFLGFSGAAGMACLEMSDESECLDLAWCSSDHVREWLAGGIRKGDGVIALLAFLESQLQHESDASDGITMWRPSSSHRRANLDFVVAECPLKAGDKLIGEILLLWPPEVMLSPAQGELLATITQLLGSCRDTAKTLRKLKRRLATMTSIDRIYRELHSTLDEQAIIEVFFEEIRGRFLLDGIAVTDCGRDAGEFRVLGKWGSVPEDYTTLCQIDPSPDEDENGQDERPAAEPASAEFSSPPYIGVSLGLWTRQSTFGSLTLVRKTSDRDETISTFPPAEVEQFREFAAHLSIAMEHCRLYRRGRQLTEINRDRVGKFSLIYEISNLFRESMDIERRLHLILTAITLGDGMGFNRAILLMVDEQRNILEGRMGIGPDSGDEANRVWRTLRRESQPYLEWILQIMKSKSYQDSRFHERVRNIRLPLTPDNGVLALTALQRKPFHVIQADSIKRCPREIQAIFGAEEFATAPLMSGDRVLGVIAVDNFYNQRPISEDDVKMLRLFANHAGVSLEMDVLHGRLREVTAELEKQHQDLIRKEKLSALGEMAAAVAHEIRNPLVAIGGFARRLDKQLVSRLTEGELNWAAIIVREVDRLEKILRDILDFARETTTTESTIDPNDLAREVMFLFESELRAKGITLVKELQTELPPIRGDAAGIRQVFINLISNAMQAMESGGTLTIRSGFDKDEHERVTVEVSDTGGGIPPEVLSNIFNPFFTTKEKGIGLGLTLAHRIIERNHGTIQVINRLGEGATFAVTFPATGVVRFRHDG